jgi:ribosome recycling factor
MGVPRAGWSQLQWPDPQPNRNPGAAKGWRRTTTGEFAMAAPTPFSLDELKTRMQKSVASLREELAGLRTGRASASLLEPVMVEAYGSKMPLNQLATVTVPEARMLSVQVWDRSMAGIVERAIRDSGLGLNPIGEGAVLRVPLPELNEERRRDLTKVAHNYAEQARVAVRHIRRDGMDHLKKLEKDGHMSEDDSRKQADLVQKATDAAVADIDAILAVKEQEIMQV